MHSLDGIDVVQILKKVTRKGDKSNLLQLAVAQCAQTTCLANTWSGRCNTGSRNVLPLSGNPEPCVSGPPCGQTHIGRKWLLD